MAKNEETLSIQFKSEEEAKVWTQFYAATMSVRTDSYAPSTSWGASIADEMLAEYRKRQLYQ